jgi:hypothetical protein
MAGDAPRGHTLGRAGVAVRLVDQFPVFPVFPTVVFDSLPAAAVTIAVLEPLM